MPRVTYVKKSQKKQGDCNKCGKKIAKGQPYRWWKFRFGGRRVRCMECPSPRQSELTNSDKLSRCYAAGESIEDAIAQFQKDFNLSDLQGAMEDAANEAREVGQEYRDSAESVESGMNNRMPICDELEEKADNLDSRADEIESGAGQLEEFSEPEKGDDETDEKFKERLEEERQTWVDEQVSVAEEFTDISPE